MGYASTREIVEALRGDDDEERDRLLDMLEGDEVADGITALDAILYDWSAWGRSEQQLPDERTDWRFLFLRAGRGGGKTRAGAEMTILAAHNHEQCGGRLALIAPTHADIRGTMVEGTSGVLACSPPWFMPEWQPGIGNGRLVWPGAEPATGQTIAAGDTVIALCFSADRPDRIRGPETGWVWGDEIAAWGINGETVHDIMDPGLRFGTKPRAVYTSTPKPTAFVEMLDTESRRELEQIAAGQRDEHDRMFIQRIWATWRNAANLPESTLASLRHRYAGTTQGRQELEAELLVDDPDAAWTQALIDAGKVTIDEVPDLDLVTVAVDNATTVSKPGVIDPSSIVGRNKDVGSNDTGISVCGMGPAPLGWRGSDIGPHFYVIADLTINAGPRAWALRALEGFATAWRRPANTMIVETNAGGDLIRANIATVMQAEGVAPELVPIIGVNARDGKETRAEPVVSLYEQGRVHHIYRPSTIPGVVAPLVDLEFQMTRFKRGRTGYKKDRADAMIHAITGLVQAQPRARTRGKRAIDRARRYVS